MAILTNSQKPGSSIVEYHFLRALYLAFGAIVGLVCFVMGATGAIKLGLNFLLPVDDYIVYYTPYQSSACDQTNVGVENAPNKQITPITRTKEEIAECEAKMKDSQEKSARSQFNRQLSEAIALTLVGFPIWLLHFFVIQEDWKKRKQV